MKAFMLILAAVFALTTVAIADEIPNVVNPPAAVEVTSDLDGASRVVQQSAKKKKAKKKTAKKKKKKKKSNYS